MAAVWELQYKLSSDSTWTTLTSGLSSSVFYFIQFGGLVNGYSYEGRIRLVTDGVAGEWAETFTFVYVDNTGTLSVNNVVFDFVSSSCVVSDITFSTFSSYLSFTIDCFSYGDFSVLLESSGSFGLSLSTSIGATTELVTGA